MKKLFLNLYRQEEGATALEYALLVVLIAIVMSIGAAVLGGGLGNLFLRSGNQVDAVSPTTIATPVTPAP